MAWTKKAQLAVGAKVARAASYVDPVYVPLKRKGYEYVVVGAEVGVEGLQGKLTELGAAGWQVCGSGPSGAGVVWVLGREVRDE